jgi:hypothetical protein
MMMKAMVVEKKKRAGTASMSSWCTSAETSVQSVVHHSWDVGVLSIKHILAALLGSYRRYPEKDTLKAQRRLGSLYS